MRTFKAAIALLSVSSALGAVFVGEKTSVDGRYIVVLSESATPAAKAAFVSKWADHQRLTNNQMDEHRIGEFHAISSQFTEDQLEEILKEKAVAYVESNKIMRASKACQKEKDTVTWGIERLNEHSKPTYDYTYTYSEDAAGVDAYILDTGIEVDHPQFEGRAKWGYNAVDDQDRDCQGHGTHVAGTVGSVTYGVAKKVSLTAVKFLGCDGSGSNLGMINSMEWISKQHQSSKRPSVVNVSAGGPYSRSVNDAMTKAIKNGVTYVVAAGNEAQDACDTSPSSVADAITVGATDISDEFASFSNWGSCVDILAPGVDITSTWIDKGTNEISGTSMATPHVAGVVALALSENPKYTPAQVTGYVLKKSTSSVVTSVPSGTVNKLAYVTCTSE